MKKNIIMLCSVIIFLFSLFIHIYDMIKNNKIRMICRSMNESYIMYISWMFIISSIIYICYYNKYLSKKHVIIFYIQFILLLISLEKDYNYRTKHNKDLKKFWKYIHYFFSLSCMITGIYSIKCIKKDNVFKFLCLCFCLLTLFHSNTNKTKNNISILLELIIIYISIFNLLVSRNKQIKS